MASYIPRNTSEPISCGICFDVANEQGDMTNMVITACKHNYHETCLTTWLKIDQAKCPVCRGEVHPLTWQSKEDACDDGDEYMASDIVEAVYRNDIAFLTEKLKLNPLDGPPHPVPLSQEVREGRGLAFGIKHRDPGFKISTTLICLAARLGHTELVLKLIEAGGDFNQTDDEGDTPLILSFVTKNEALALKLIELGADIHACNKLGLNAAYYAAMYSAKASLEVLIEKGANLHVKRSDTGCGIMHAAARFSSAEMICFLHINHVNIDATDFNNATPLHSAEAKMKIIFLLSMLLLTKI
jgi:hypothetical protein